MMRATIHLPRILARRRFSRDTALAEKRGVIHLPACRASNADFAHCFPQKKSEPAIQTRSLAHLFRRLRPARGISGGADGVNTSRASLFRVGVRTTSLPEGRKPKRVAPASLRVGSVRQREYQRRPAM